MDDKVRTVKRAGDYKVSNNGAIWTANGYRLSTGEEWQFAGFRIVRRVLE